MPLIADYILDLPLAAFTANTTELHITTQEATNYTQATATYTIGVKAGLTPGVPANGVANGRRVTVPFFADGTATATGTATHWAIVDDDNVLLMATGRLASPLAVVDTNNFTLTAFDILFPDAVQA